MSYDFLLSYCHENDNSFKSEVYFNSNYTFNVSPMFYKVEPEQGIKALSGLSTYEARPMLEKFVIYFITNREELVELNPENGWGDYKGAFKLLCEMLEANYIASHKNDGSTGFVHG